LRLFLLFSLLGVTLSFAVLRAEFWLEYLPRPISCSGEEPAWLSELVARSGKWGWPGFQLSYVSAFGERSDCAVGWSTLAEPMSDKQIMRYASLSKVFTSVVMGQLFTEQRLQPTDRLVDILAVHGPMLDPRIAEITLDQLLRHTAGFDRNLDGDPMLLEQPWCPGYIEALGQLRLNHSPGEQYVYSNLGYCLLGAVIAKVEQEPLSDVFRQRLRLDQALSVAPVVRGEIRLGEPERYFQDPESQQRLLSLDYSALMAAGSWSGTGQDLLNLLQLWFTGDNSSLLKVPPCNVTLWRNCHGSAFYTYQQKNGPLMFWRDGSLPGVSAFMAVFDDGSKVVVLANGRRVQWVSSSDQLGLYLYDRLQ
jgi:D-alanyl-D-alanine carboxypeptidase